MIVQCVRSSRKDCTMGISKPDLIEGMVKGMAVLEAFDTERQRLNATLAAQRAGITRAAARRHLLTLHHLGYLESDGRFFWLAPKVMRFSGSYLASARLPRLVQPVLNQLATQHGHAFSAVVLDGEEVVIVARSDATRMLAYGLHLGARLPVHATSTGRVLLAAQSDAWLGHWLQGRTLSRLTPNTVIQTEVLRARIELAREQDHALSVDEHELGVTALSVPLRNVQGQVLAALNVVLPTTDLPSAEVIPRFLPSLQVAAQSLRASL
jgi:IclR family pca regulon transcriptional regulator